MVVVLNCLVESCRVLIGRAASNSLGHIYREDGPKFFINSSSLDTSTLRHVPDESATISLLWPISVPVPLLDIDW